MDGEESKTNDNGWLINDQWHAQTEVFQTDTDITRQTGRHERIYPFEVESIVKRRIHSGYDALTTKSLPNITKLPFYGTYCIDLCQTE